MYNKALFVLLLLLGSNGQAAEISGIKLADQVTLQGKTLKLNGTGLRQATILKVNVYAAGLYLENRSTDAEAIASSDQLKSIEMVFMRDVSAQQVAEALQEGLDKNCEGDCTKLKPRLAELQRLAKDMKKGDALAYHFYPDRIELLIRGQKAGSVEGGALSHQLIRSWIGRNPPNAGLKEGLLGLRKS